MPDPSAMDAERWTRTVDYIQTLFCAEQAPAHDALRERATAAGLPPIDVGPEAGRFLQLLVRLAGGRLAVEVGTLGGSSAIWMAGGLVDGGRIITIDSSAAHLTVARAEFERAGVAARIDARHGTGGATLPTLVDELGKRSVDLILLDAQRSEYFALIDTVAELLRPGGLLVIDNALSAGRWTADPIPEGEKPDTMDLVNRQVAADRRFKSTVVPVGNGLLLAVRG